MRKTNFTHDRKNVFSNWSSLVLISIITLFGLQEVQAQCALACNGNTQVSLDENCEAEITPAMILNADTTICPRGVFEVTVSYHGVPIPTSPVVTCDYKDLTLQVMVRDTNSGNTCWGNIFIEDKLPPRIECGMDTIYCYQMPKYTGPHITDNCRKAALITEIDLTSANDAMNEAFGEGNWDSLQYSTLSPEDLLTCKYDVIYLDGWGPNSTSLSNFLASHRSKLEAWVDQGGSLLINSELTGTGTSIGFGGVSIVPGPLSDTAFVNDPDHPIFNGPFCPVIEESITRSIFTVPFPVSFNIVCPP
ncbi:MAG: hypothetical protein R3275_11595, partial [Saprospiraceae bacterium]|nr:hypothetical protein [Saprospiraceae bacterium]